MRNFSLLFSSLVFVSFLVSSCTPSCGRERAKNTPTDSVARVDTPVSDASANDDFHFNENDTLPVGDVNGDGLKDTAYLVNHEPLNDTDGVYVTLSFSCAVPSFRHSNGFHGLTANVGDLDGNGTEEFIYYPDWYQSNWAEMWIYGYRNGKWVQFGQGTALRDRVGEAPDPIQYLQSRVQKINNRRFRITEHVMDEETADIAEKTSTVEITR